MSRQHMIISKDAFYSQAAAVRRFADTKLNMGTSGSCGGVDGEMCGMSFWKVLQEIIGFYQCTDPNAYGCDMGHGSGIACMAYFNGGPMSLNMIGFECNEDRCFYSWELQKGMLSHPKREDFRAMAKKSQFYFGDGVSALIATLGMSGPILHCVLFYWFREGWSPEDIEAVVKYLNEFLVNLEVFVCDMTCDTLRAYGFNRELLSSAHVSGPMNKSTNSRTLYVHHFQPKISKSTNARGCAQKEKEILLKFADDYSPATSLSDKIDKFWAGRVKSKGLRHKIAVRFTAPLPIIVVSRKRATSAAFPNNQRKLTASGSEDIPVISPEKKRKLIGGRCSENIPVSRPRSPTIVVSRDAAVSRPCSPTIFVSREAAVSRPRSPTIVDPCEGAVSRPCSPTIVVSREAAVSQTMSDN